MTESARIETDFIVMSSCWAFREDKVPYHLFRTWYLNNLDKLRRVNIGILGIIFSLALRPTQSKSNSNLVAVRGKYR